MLATAHAIVKKLAHMVRMLGASSGSINLTRSVINSEFG